MRILGVVTGTKDLHVAVVTNAGASAHAVTLKKIVLPIDEDESARLHRTLQLMDTLILDEKVDRIAVVKAGQAQFGNASSVRPKVECVIQLAGVGRNLPVSVVPQQTLRAFEKKNDPNGLIGEAGFKPVGSRDAALAAWIDLRKYEQS
jgi:Holliday junction resolvasome RuvABC endonuclease subunit